MAQNVSSDKVKKFWSNFALCLGCWVLYPHFSIFFMCLCFKDALFQCFCSSSNRRQLLLEVCYLAGGREERSGIFVVLVHPVLARLYVLSLGFGAFSVNLSLLLMVAKLCLVSWVGIVWKRASCPPPAVGGLLSYCSRILGPGCLLPLLQR